MVATSSTWRCFDMASTLLAHCGGPHWWFAIFPLFWIGLFTFLWFVVGPRYWRRGRGPAAGA